MMVYGCAAWMWRPKNSMPVTLSFSKYCASVCLPVCLSYLIFATIFAHFCCESSREVEFRILSNPSFVSHGLSAYCCCCCCCCCCCAGTCNVISGQERGGEAR